MASTCFLYYWIVEYMEGVKLGKDGMPTYHLNEEKNYESGDTQIILFN